MNRRLGLRETVSGRPPIFAAMRSLGDCDSRRDLYFYNGNFDIRTAYWPFLSALIGFTILSVRVALILQYGRGRF